MFRTARNRGADGKGRVWIESKGLAAFDRNERIENALVFRRTSASGTVFRMVKQTYVTDPEARFLTYRKPGGVGVSSTALMLLTF